MKDYIEVNETKCDEVYNCMCTKEVDGKISSTAEKEDYVAQTRAVVKVCGDDGNNSLLKAMGKKNDRKND